MARGARRRGRAAAARSTTSTPTAPRRRSTTAPRRIAIKRGARRARAARSRSPRRSRRSGTCSGAAGAVEAVATLLALRDRIAPPTLGLAEREEGLDLDYVPGSARPLTRPRRQAAARALELVRLRRPQRRALPGGARDGRARDRVRASAPSTSACERRSSAWRSLTDPGSLQLLRTQACARAAWASAPGPATACSRRTRASTAGRSTATRRTPSFAGGSLGEAHAQTIVEVHAAGRPRARAGDRRSSSRPARACRRASRRCRATGGSSPSTSACRASCRRSRSSAARPPAGPPTARR